MGIATVNPTTGEVCQTFTRLSATEIEAKLALADTTFQAYRQTTFAQRSQWLYRTAELLELRREEYGKLMTFEMGKPLQAAIAEVEKCAWVCRFYAEAAEGFLADHEIRSDAAQSGITYQPIGVVLAVMPWNFPFWQVFRFAAPALMAGNVGLLKHASNVPQTALKIAEIFQEAGFPEGAFQTLLIEASQVATVVADRRIAAATLTGSEAAGSSLAMHAGKALKKVVLELGGSDPFIVMASADLEAAVQTAVTARTMNNGQSCIAAKRFILAEPIADEFIQRLTEKFALLTVGDPMQLETQIGPLATPSILADIHRQVQATIAAGAKVHIGGKPLDRPGNFYPPTILSAIPINSPGAREEFFGPVALVFRVPDLASAIKLANQTEFGLGASAWTNNPEEQQRCIREIEAGAVFINGMVKSDPRLPFGGIKKSGFGRELGRLGIHEFVNIKTVWVK
ncbi:NAD-dependent succinate-semialdehyde dehydrogenase [filamentous cyanobacterium LEGE 11480]|uniref:NAD-dependent succinate-semialdehyde dehydrogenase n=1 Tax=Romeriopsis navalis LEGE 11480 TaxID=2777977 RepID=A0A928VT55_9CYAN|nr:NAD-dependent succinate-semialdehyde dehydrogenase [Romeriopsis navalis]MBE9031769.1 NAD-dependent succinate-semialdehyde dehydrogenase [Romeriopsis navalis LEGE 11480]